MGFTLQVVTNTDVGLVRQRNEDAVTSDPDRGIVVVADGMGGHPSGNVASRIASEEALAVLSTWTSDQMSPPGADDDNATVPHLGAIDDDSGKTLPHLSRASDQAAGETLPHLSPHTGQGSSGGSTLPHLSDPSATSADPGIDTDDESSPTRMGLRMAKAVIMADRKVRLAGQEDPEKDGMGTTVTALLADSELGHFAIGHVGDSRAYRLREGALEQLTRDDSWVQDQVDAGLLTEQGARYHPWSSVLSQALGLDEPASPSVVEGTLREGDIFLLCSDGLCGFVTDEEIESVMADTLESGLDFASEALIDAAKTHGAPDNVTVGLVRVGSN